MKKLILALSFCCSLALAENTASAPINKSTQNSSNDQPKLIMVKGVTSNQTNYTAPQKQASKAKKTSSHKPTKARKSTKKAKHTKTTAKKTAHTSHTKKPTQAQKYSSK